MTFHFEANEPSRVNVDIEMVLSTDNRNEVKGVMGSHKLFQFIPIKDCTKTYQFHKILDNDIRKPGKIQL